MSVPSAPEAAGVRIWQLMLPGPGPGRGGCRQRVRVLAIPRLRTGKHHLLLEAYGYRWYRVGDLDYLLKCSETETRARD